MDFIATTWPKAFFGITIGQAILCLAFEAYTFGEFQNNIGNYVYTPNTTSQYRTIPTFLALFIFGYLYEVVLVWDALRMKNTIQIIGVCIANLALLIYSALQIGQIETAISQLSNADALKTIDGHTGAAAGDILWNGVRGYLIATPCIIALASLIMAFIAWKLYRVFAWDILKQIGADYRMKKRFLYYQIYIALLKFDFFFFLGFTVQFLAVVSVANSITTLETRLTIAAIPITILILLCAAVFTQRENKTGMWCIIVLYFGGLAYFFFKLVRIYQPGHEAQYMAVRKSLTAFAVLTILLIILTIINAFICMGNFGNGLKGHLLKKNRDDEKLDQNNVNLQDVKPQQPSRMTIE